MIVVGATRFQRDLERLVDTSRPVALARFGDGEYHLLHGLPYRAGSDGWVAHKEVWLRTRLLESLRARMDGYLVGISPPCDWPKGTAYYRPLVRGEMTFATIFSHANYLAFQTALQGPLAGACIVGCTGKVDYKVPAQGAVVPFDIDGLVEKLLGERRPILVAAGPCACVIVHDYWKKCPSDHRQTILDVGAALDLRLHGKETRNFHNSSSPLRAHVCDFGKSVPWSPGTKKPVIGYRAVLAGARNKYGGGKLK